ncbi:hypothetical protein [Demequina capsici]|uniref:Terminase n=1 Tax=Demequina capsici TaxID=3075620 RepID=A0AA96F892_9MICO|nr:hypothetical protein [Demequina sp. OYTSA14]WNM25237.1 hypothetical protein RN606_03560 [Demequina sp. OYTSA14]
MSRPKNAPQFTLFDAAIQPPPVGSASFIPNLDPVAFGWDEKVARVLPPQVLTGVIPNDHARGVFLMGAQAMGLVGRRREIQPQQLLQADVLNSGRKFVDILQPRRATKTSGILAWVIGRCLAEPDLSAAFTICTTGKATRQKFIKEVVPPLERTWPFEDDRPMKILRGAGAEMLKFNNGSFLSFVPFKGESFRSDAFDIIVLDESQDPEPEDVDDVLAAIMPTLDTRPGAQVVRAGTAGEFREGNMLWDALVAGESGDDRHSAMIYRAPVDHETVDAAALVADWDTVEELVLKCHPGVASGLTPMDAVKDNWRTLKPLKFAAEYLGIFGRAASSTFISIDDYNAQRQDGDLPAPPKHFRYGLQVHPDQTSWSLVAAWRDEQRRPHLLVLGTGPATLGAYEECRRLYLKYHLPVAYDSGLAANHVVTDRFDRTRPKTKANPLAWADIATAHATLYAEIRRRALVHWGHEGMEQAVRDTVKRGTRDAKRWAFGRVHDDADITTLEAGAVALKAYDDAPEPSEPLGIISA